MSEENKDKGTTTHANSIIKNHMIWSMGAGFIPVPIADFFAVGAIQLDMIRQLCKVYEVDFKETEGKAVITALAGSGLSRLGARAVKFIPGIGTAIGGITLAVLSGGSTYAIGEVFKTHFETGGTFLDFDPQRLKKFYDEKFEKGKQMARSMEKDESKKYDNGKDVEEPSTTSDTDTKSSSSETSKPIKDLVKQLESITQMKNDGLLTEEEFTVLKGKIIAAKDAG